MLGRGNSSCNALKQRNWHLEELKGEDSMTREWKEERQKTKAERQEKPDVIGLYY